MFFNPQKYDFSRVGRLKLNTKLGLNTPLDEKILHPQDFYEVIKYLLKLRQNPANVDDIDHLGNRRVRSVGELLENQFRIGLVRMERAIKEKMSVYQEMATAMPHDLINAKPVMAAIREFFGSSQLSQFMDQTNPLSEITHKRRLSALGPGGLSRERAGFEVRDVHPTHYGRICPIETPEGPNIGLISSLSCYARINEFGFIESPYRKVKDGRVTDYVIVTNAGGSKYKAGDIVEADELVSDDGRPKKKGVEFEPYSFYLSAWEEDQYIIAQANAKVDDDGNLIAGARQRASGGQLHPGAARHDPVHRRLAEAARLGRRVAHPVPRERRREPRADGIEHAAPGGAAAPRPGAVCRHRHGVHHGARLGRGHRRAAVGHHRLRRLAAHRRARRERDGRQPRQGDGRRHLPDDEVQALEPEHLHHPEADRPGRPEGAQGAGARRRTVHRARRAGARPQRAGRVHAVARLQLRGRDPRLRADGEGRLLHVDPHRGVRDRVARHQARAGGNHARHPERLGELPASDLDESGIIRIGANVKPGDILVGKVTPKGETQLTPEEKLLRAIFGEKAGDVRDASLICPPGIEGIIVGVKIFSRKGIEKDDRAKAIEQEELDMMEKNLQDEIRILHDEVKKRVIVMLKGQQLRSDLFDEYGRERLLKKGTELTQEILQEMPYETMVRLKIATDDTRLEDDLRDLEERTERQVEVIKNLFEEKKEKIRRGDELPPGVIKLVKVYVAMKRKLSVGDKMAGRHGNKGVIARILPEEDMPYLPDGTPVEIVLNPLGVPSRMNVGQILETHLGWAAHALGLYFATPVFDGATEAEIKNWLDRAGLPTGGKTKLYDGMTGDEFEQNVTVGYIYMLKLSHLVDDKIHARSIGPYSLITQQPLGGKAQFGGQRFGEMEVWALEAYGVGAHPPGAAHREVGRRDRAREDLRGDRQGRRVVHGRPARVVQRAHPRAPVALSGRRADEDEEEAGKWRRSRCWKRCSCGGCRAALQGRQPTRA